MRFIEGDGECKHVIELTRRNLEVLLLKLDDPLSHRTLMDPDSKIWVVAVDDDEHYSDREPGAIFMPSSGRML